MRAASAAVDISYINSATPKNYPFGKSDTILPSDATPAQKSSIDAEVDRILDIHDAISDLAIAESVHQAVQGNYDRAAATLDTYSKGNFPPDPDVVQTPRSGITLTHRVGLHLEAGISSDPNATPRTQAEPALDKWLATILPNANQVACKVTYLDPITNTQIEHIVTQQDLEVQPINLLYLLRTDSESAMTELDDRILLFIKKTFTPRPDILIEIKYTERLSTKISFFELVPMMHSLRSLILRSRPLKSSDITLQNQATQAQAEQIFIDHQRIDLPQGELVILKTDLEPFKLKLATLLENIPINRAQIFADVDIHITTAIDLLTRASRFGIPQSGWGFALDWKRLAFIELLDRVRELTVRWQDRLTQFDAKLIEYAALPGTTTDQERFTLLQQAERLVSTIITSPQPATPDDLRTIIIVKGSTFANKLNSFKGVLRTTITSVVALRNSIEILLPIADFDLIDLDLTNSEKQIILFTTDLATAIGSLFKEVERRIQTVPLLR